jgi:predicted DNA-binding protein (MmcQ/YjbR family)
MSLDKLAASLRKVALTYPETYEEQPWGDRVVKVRGKIFFSCGTHNGLLYATVKVPKSGRKLLERPYAEPTHYGMGKHGWVTLKFDAAKKVPVEELRGWIDESFRAVAPKKLTADSSQPTARPVRAPKVLARAILVCSDKLRAKRAVDELANNGIGVEVVERADQVKLGKAKALIVDIGRNPIEGIKLAAEVDASDAAVHLFVAGVRDADQARQLRGLGSAETFRAPPGDAEVVGAVAAALTRKGGARRAP